ncbi:MAG TPA: UDP-N-acetylmuramoyl-tripeptide--D-alanyl-D-alanine ligase [Pyrinomonadaceae bacterium]|nr:UDP-N-acetylmuramoyl-tripeptide--D-alanyl-D-alanine ligase [Pyrinomonadaceae bacterium]
MKTSDAARLMRATAFDPPSAAVAGPGVEFFDKELTGFSIDTRTTREGELFFALSPEDYRRHFFTGASFDDGHRFIPAAFERGATAAVARRASVEAEAGLRRLADRLLLVEDVIEALQLLARGVLDRWGGRTVGITGSAGKTTAKDLTAHVLAHAGRRVLKTHKNFNNELGLALSILQMESHGARPSDFDVAVLEMGQSLFGEIRRLCEVAPPDIGCVLVVAPVHLEFFESVEQIAEGKAQLVEGIKPGGVAVLNADDERVAAMRSKHEGRAITFGVEQTADVAAAEIEPARLGLTRFRLCTPLGESIAELPLPGRHNLMNALAASAVATCFGVTPDVIAAALSTARASEMRGEVVDFAAGFSLVDDSYNANPRSLLSMARSLVEGRGEEEAAARRTVVVAGEMLELGETGPELHREAGREIAALGVDVLWGVRGLARDLVEGARAAGMSEQAARFFETTDEAAEAIVKEVRPGDLVLVKGSRGVHTERIVERLRAAFPAVGEDEQ